MAIQKTKPGNIAVAEIERLLDKQTEAILTAVDDRFSKVDDRFSKLERQVDDRFSKSAIAVDDRFSKLERQVEALDVKFSKKFDSIIVLLDKMSKQFTDYEQELELMKRDLKRVKAVIKERLGVEV